MTVDRSTRRMKRMSRGSGRSTRGPGFNLTSLMDVFTILVFFLLVNASSAEQLPDQREMELPESIAETTPDETVIVMVTRTQILVQGRVVSTLEDALASQAPTIPAVSAELQRARERVIGATTRAIATRDKVTIMADKEIPFRLLRTLMQSSSQAGYTQVSLAVSQVGGQVAMEPEAES